MNHPVRNRIRRAPQSPTAKLSPHVMKNSPLQLTHLVVLLSCGLGWSDPAFAADLQHAKNGSGVYGYKDTPRLPFCDYLVHDCDRPAPKRVDPGKAGPPAPAPADAIVLFDGKDLSHWEATEYKLVDGCVEASGSSPFRTKAEFSSYQLHLEWQAPAHFTGEWYNRGNNGVLLMGLFEIQVFDSYNEKIYPDGQAAAIYGQTPPLVNATRPPGEWEVFDICFTAPTFDGDKLVQPARVTMFHNGLLVHLNTPIYGETGHRILPEYKTKKSQGPLALGAHNCPVRFRNLWLRPLP